MSFQGIVLFALIAGFLAPLSEQQKAPAETCLLPKKVGRCKAHMPRWWYDAESNMCMRFIYGGCRANANNFLTEEACSQACVKPQQVCGV